MHFHPYKEAEYFLFITHNNTKFILNGETMKWMQADKMFFNDIPSELKHQKAKPLSTHQASELQSFYGENIIETKKKPFLELFFESLLTPLNVYEIILIVIGIQIEAHVLCIIYSVYVTI